LSAVYIVELMMHGHTNIRFKTKNPFSKIFRDS